MGSPSAGFTLATTCASAFLRVFFLTVFFNRVCFERVEDLNKLLIGEDGAIWQNIRTASIQHKSGKPVAFFGDVAV
eukprot:5571939-Pyramimonas_sp.AAC.1